MVRLSCLVHNGANLNGLTMNILKIGLAIATAATLIAPNSAHAQRGGMGGMGGRGGRGGGMGGNRQGSGGGQEFSTKDLEKENPITMLIDKRKDLKLTTPQLEKLANLKDSLKVKNDTIYTRLDSMSKSMRGGSYGSGGDNETARSARAVFSSDLAEVRDNFDAAAQSALALLDDDQKKTAGELLDKLRKDNEPRGGRRGRGGNPGAL